MRRAARKDLNHKAITDTISILRDKYGFRIDFTDCHQLKGFCDFILTFGGHRQAPENNNWIIGCEGNVILVEVKRKGKKITDAEDEFLNRNAGNYAKVENMHQLFQAMLILTVRDSVREEVDKMIDSYETFSSDFPKIE